MTPSDGVPTIVPSSRSVPSHVPVLMPSSASSSSSPLLLVTSSSGPELSVPTATSDKSPSTTKTPTTAPSSGSSVPAPGPTVFQESVFTLSSSKPVCSSQLIFNPSNLVILVPLDNSVSDEISFPAVYLRIPSSHPSMSSPLVGVIAISPSFMPRSSPALNSVPSGKPLVHELHPSWAEKPSSSHVSTLKLSSTASSFWARQWL